MWLKLIVTIMKPKFNINEEHNSCMENHFSFEDASSSNKEDQVICDKGCLPLDYPMTIGTN